MGRIQASAWPSREPRCWNELESGTPQGDRMRLEVEEGNVALQYERLSVEGRWTLQVRDSVELQMRWAPADSQEADERPAEDTAPVVYEQLASGRVGFQVGLGAEAIRREAASLWHLLLLWPEDFERYLAPQLAKIRGDWRLDPIVSLAVDKLFLWPAAPDMSWVAQQVAELKAESFARRQAAQAALQKAGIAIVPLLDALERQQTWDDEQRLRVEHIRRMVTGRGPDRFERLAVWLAGDADVWLALMRDADPHRRALAFDRFCHIALGDFEFDPQAPELRRGQQVARIMEIRRSR